MKRPLIHARHVFAMAMLLKILGSSAETSGQGAAATGSADRIRRYNVVWTSPSKDASGVMPLGNGDIAAGIYAIEDGDLYLLLSKNDAFNYAGDIYKTGRVRVSLIPNLFKAGRPFRQTLDLPTGSIRIEADGVTLRVWADAHRAVYHVEIQAPREIAVTAQPEFWKRLDGTRDVQVDRQGRILWYFAVGDRSVYADDLKFYQVESMAAKHPDPYRFNTFGHLLESPAMSLQGGVLSGKAASFDIRIHSCGMQTPDAAQWIETIERQAARPVDVKADWEEHCRWWADFWDRGWVIASDNSLPPELREKFSGEPSSSGSRSEDDGAAVVAQSYNVFRYLMACQSRGRVQTKFNGGLFTQQLRVGSSESRPAAARQKDGMWLTHEDDRLWGRRFTYQNQRLLYWPLLASGDFDLMKPFFGYYYNLLEMRTAVTKAWFGHEGAYYRENIEPTGAERDCDHGGRPPKTRPGEKYEGWYHDYYFTSGLETLAMMAEYVKYTGDLAFRDRVLVPFAREVLLFFDRHYPRGADGKLRIQPAQVLETWWIAVNPAPDVAGLRFSLDELLAMKAGTPEDQAHWHKFRAEIPEVALRKIEGRPAIAPAEEWEKQSNAENGELYPVFPFRCFGLGLGSGETVAWTMKHRTCKDVFDHACWTQDQIHWAYAGNAAEASDGLARRFRIASTMCRFPMYGREGPDSCPDFDHFGAGATALQRMLVQEAGGKTLLLPAWPADWDADFKLHLAGGAVITGTVKDGKLLTWGIRPSERRKDVVVCRPQTGVAVAPGVPANAHPLRAGSDQARQNRFQGKIGRVTMFRGKLSPAMVRELAGGDRSRPVAGPQVVGSWINPKPGDTLTTKAEDFAGPVSFEAWIQPGENEQGRVLDKITVGVDDGLLLDAWPKLSLRLIVGTRRTDFPSVLKPAVWQHVAVIIDRGTPRVYLDGKQP
jgi:alpha-L-fucosidase 2